MKLAVQYGEKVEVPRVPLGEGPRRLRGAAPRSRCWSPTSSQDPRYINVVADVRSELAIPMLLKDRCIGVLDLESPELDAFSKRDVEILTLLASQAAVAIENARLYEERARQRGAAREGGALRAARAGGAAARRPAEAAEGRRGRRAVRVRRASSAATSTTSCRRSRTGSWWRSATCRARACRRRSTACSPPSSCAAARSGGATCPIDRARRACCRRSTRSCTSGSSRSITARSATRSSI